MDRLDVPDEKSYLSTRATLYPRRAASRAIMDPVLPPPITTTSKSVVRKSFIKLDQGSSAGSSGYTITRRRDREAIRFGTNLFLKRLQRKNRNSYHTSCKSANNRSKFYISNNR